MRFGIICTSILSLAALALSNEGKSKYLSVLLPTNLNLYVYIAVGTSEIDVVVTAAFPETNAFNCMFLPSRV
jgi:hypothetical protein